MAKERQFEDAIKIASVEAEYRRIALTPCSNCGNRLGVRKQTLEIDDETGKHYDLLDARCIQCGKMHEFLFDIDPFFGNPQSE